MSETPRKLQVSLEDLLRVKRAERPGAEFWAEFERSFKARQQAAMSGPHAEAVPEEAVEAVPVSLEDLLRIKRAERPPAEFWEEFERGMRTKQLAAIVEPRPWWAPLIRIGARVARYQVPAGAAAVLAVTFLTLREYRTVDMAPVNEPAIAVESPAFTADASRADSGPVATSAPMVIQQVSAPMTAAADIPSAPAVEARAAAALVGSSSHVVPVDSELRPSARYIAENLAAATADDPELNQMLGLALRNVESQSRRQEPLAKVSVPGDSRRSRYFQGTEWTASPASYGGDSALRTDEHSTRRLTERRLSESEVSRFDANSSTLTVKF